MEFFSHSTEETEWIAAKYAEALVAGDIVTLDGELGAGKTAFARGLLQGIGYHGRVTSPTFSIANEYDTEKAKVVHFDMYRIQSEEALWELGFDEYLDGKHIVLIEWSKNIINALPIYYKTVEIIYGTQENERIITTGEVRL